MSYQDEAERLTGERMKLVKAERDLLDTIKAGDTPSAEQRQELDRYAEGISATEDRIRTISNVEQREREGDQLRELTGQVFGSQHAADKAAGNEQDMIRAWLSAPAESRPDLQVNTRAAAKERAMLRAGADWQEIRNAVTWDTGSMASAVPTEMARSLYEYMEASIAAFRIGAQQINTSSGENIDFPQVAAHGIGTQVSGQGTALAGTDPTFDKLTLGANKYGQLVVVANEVLTDAAFDVASFLGQNIGRALGRLVDQHLINGTGSVTNGIVGNGVTASSAGLGSTNTGGTLTTTVGLNPTWLIDAVHNVNDEYRNAGAAWLFNDSAAADIRKIRDGAGGTEGAFLWEPSRNSGLINGQPDTLLGFPAFTDPNIASIASNNIIGAFGDFSTYYLRQVGNVQIAQSSERYFDTDQTGFRGKWRGDGGYADTNGVGLLKNQV